MDVSNFLLFFCSGEGKGSPKEVGFVLKIPGGGGFPREGGGGGGRFFVGAEMPTKSLMSKNFPPAILGPEMAAPI